MLFYHLLPKFMEEFDAKYADYCQQYLDGGYQAILDEKQALWDEGSYIAD